MQRVILTTDLSDEATRAFDPAIEYAKSVGADIELLHVIEDLRVAPPDPAAALAESAASLNAEREAVKGRLEAIAKSLDVTATTTVLVAADVAGAIVAHARDVPDTLICMSTHGRTGWRHLLLGSVTEQVLRHATVPVITIPRKEQHH